MVTTRAFLEILRPSAFSWCARKMYSNPWRSRNCSTAVDPNMMTPLPRGLLPKPKRSMRPSSSAGSDQHTSVAAMRFAFCSAVSFDGISKKLRIGGILVLRKSRRLSSPPVYRGRPPCVQKIRLSMFAVNGRCVKTSFERLHTFSPRRLPKSATHCARNDVAPYKFRSPLTSVSSWLPRSSVTLCGAIAFSANRKAITSTL
mmetsp:Transcript_11757/g.36527  ORF Transcript_11757/g.36527 Transcript_11757/m.36527 type:complete len:201 (-) Transcript_11757:1179-1781(-)